MKFSILGIAMFGGSLLLGSVPLLLIGNSQLNCERRANGSGQCQLVNGSLLRGKRQTFTLQEFQKAEVQNIRQQKGRFIGTPSLQVVLYTKQGILPLGSSTTPSSGNFDKGLADHEEQVRRINSFLASTQEKKLKEGQDNTLMIFIFLLLFGSPGLIAGLMLSDLGTDPKL